MTEQFFLDTLHVLGVEVEELQGEHPPTGTAYRLSRLEYQPIRIVIGGNRLTTEQVVAICHQLYIEVEAFYEHVAYRSISGA